MTETFKLIPAGAEARHARDLLLQKISEDTCLPALGSSVSRVIQLASSDDEAVHHLAYFVLSDVALTQKILRLSNTVCYRTVYGSQVTTVSKAIFLLGFDTVKTSALAMKLVEGMSGRHGRSVRKELAHALTAGIIGRELARRTHYKDAEEAAIAALFKNIGRVLVAAHDNVRYREIAKLIESGSHSPSQACMQALGCSFENLAESVLREWQIPDSIIQALSPLPAGVLKVARSRQEWQQQVAGFSTAAATLVSRINDQGGDIAIKALVSRFGLALNLDYDGMTQLFATVAEETRVLNDTADLPSLTADTEAAPQPVVEQGLSKELLLFTAPAGSLEIKERHASGKPVNAGDLLVAGIQELTELMASGRCKANDLIMLALETLFRSMGFRFATVCLRDMKTEQFRARIALGEDNARRQLGFAFPIASNRDLFHLAMENNVDFLIPDASDPKIQELIPAWHRSLLPDARSFIVLPLVVQKKPFGFFYADRVHVAPEGVPADETALIKTLKGQVLAALGSHQVVG
jgi:HD-like signal output (HDOD) protein